MHTRDCHVSSTNSATVTWVRRGCSERMMVRANRYALAAAQDGVALEPSVRALHGCDNPGVREGTSARRDGSVARCRRLPARQHGDDGPGPPWRWPAGGAPRDRRAGAAPRPGGRFAGCGARRLGRRRGGAGAVDTSRTDTVVNRRSTAQKADRMAAGGAAAPVWEWRISGRSGRTTIAPRRVAGARPAEEGRRGMSRRRAA